MGLPGVPDDEPVGSRLAGGGQHRAGDAVCTESLPRDVAYRPPGPRSLEGFGGPAGHSDCCDRSPVRPPAVGRSIRYRLTADSISGRTSNTSATWVKFNISRGISYQSPLRPWAHSDVPSRIGDSRDGRGWGPTPTRPDRRRGSGPEGEPNRPTVPPPRRWRKKANYRTTRKRGSRTRRHAGGTRLKGARVGNAGESPAPADRGGRTRPTQVEVHRLHRRRQHPVGTRVKPGGLSTGGGSPPKAVAGRAGRGQRLPAGAPPASPVGASRSSAAGPPPHLPTKSGSSSPVKAA